MGIVIHIEWKIVLIICDDRQPAEGAETGIVLGTIQHRVVNRYMYIDRRTLGKWIHRYIEMILTALRYNYIEW